MVKVTNTAVLRKNINLKRTKFSCHGKILIAPTSLSALEKVYAETLAKLKKKLECLLIFAHEGIISLAKFANFFSSNSSFWFVSKKRF